MLILGLDTATPDTAAAVTAEEGRFASPMETEIDVPRQRSVVVAERLIGPGPRGRPRHGPELLGAVEECVDEAGGWERIERIAVGIGPGSFTGLRIGVASARALAQARELPLAGVGSLEALAAGIGELPEARDRPRLAVIDARRAEVFVLLADPAAGSDEPIVAAPEALGDRIPGVAGALAAGDGAVRFRSAIETAGAEVLGDDHPAHRISARNVCLLGAAAAAGPAEDVRPRYIRPPDAERWIDRSPRN